MSGSEFVTGLDEFGIPLKGLGQMGQSLVRIAALQMNKSDVALGDGELGTAGGSLLIVAQASLEAAALQADTAKLHHGFRHVHGLTRCFA